MNLNPWPFPGSRWWKFDFHTHTPASLDTRSWQVAIGTENEITPEKWLLKYMQAEIDCVVIADHNTGAWVGKLKTAYSEMQQNQPEGFRELTLFPGVELSVNGGIHLIAVFDTDASARDIEDLLVAVDFQGTQGDSDGVTNKTIKQVIEIILQRGGIPIPAHADKDKGLLQCQLGTKRAARDANTVKAALSVPGLLSVEWCDEASPLPEAVKQEAPRLAKVLGSDCHSFRGSNIPGSAFTWVKMATPPSLEGLRLALMDGGDFSLWRSTQGEFQPFNLPQQIITQLIVENARLMGRGHAQTFNFSPYFNCIVGGRGTGKSTAVHALRLAARRNQELDALGENNSSLKSFQSFIKLGNNKNQTGALMPETKITLEWLQNGKKTRLHWQPNTNQPQVEEWQNGQWQASASQAINPQRFPIRIFSQGQIAALAGEGRQSLLRIIDEAAHIDEYKVTLEELKRTYLVQAAQLREMQGRLADTAEINRRLSEAQAKVQTFQQSDHAELFSAYSKNQHQSREVKRTFNQLTEKSLQLQQLAEELYLDDWPEQYFKDDAGIVAWRTQLDEQVKQAREALFNQFSKLQQLENNAKQEEAYKAWQQGIQTTEQRYTSLQSQLAEQGINSQQQHAEQVALVNSLQAQLKENAKLKADCQAQQQTINTQFERILQQRQAITEKRIEFLHQTLADNEHVQMQVQPFGYNEAFLEQQLRELLDIEDGRFADALAKRAENGDLIGGLVQLLISQPQLTGVLELKEKLLMKAPELGATFMRYLERKLEQAEFADHIQLWFPEDDLQVQYKRAGNWSPIDSGSQGQRSAAMLAFLLAFGEEPIVLDQPEDDLDNQLIYELIVKQIKEKKSHRQLIIVTHNPNIVVNGDAEYVQVMGFENGQCRVQQQGALQQADLRQAVCNVMEGGQEAFANRWYRIGAKNE